MKSLICDTLDNNAGDIKLIIDDGGRSKYFTGRTQPGDCVIRAIAIASGKDYKDIYDEMFILNKQKSKGRCKVAKWLQKHGSSPRNGTFKEVYHDYILQLGFEWVSCMGIGTGMSVHVCASELPGGVLILRLSKHLVAVKNKVLHDTHDCSRCGTRGVYGYYRFMSK